MSYQMDTRSLAEIRREMKQVVLAQLEQAKANQLSGVVSIIYGDRMDVGQVDQMPLIWILPTSHQPELRGGHTAIHDFAFQFVVMIHDLDHELGKERAEDLSARVYDVINEMRRTHRSMFFDVRPIAFDPFYETVANSNIYWSACEFVFRVQRRE